MFPGRNLELYYWDEFIGDMNTEVFDVNYDRDLKDITKIEILLMDYPICDEVAVVTYKGERLTPLTCPVLYTVDDMDKTIFTTVAYSPNPEYNDVLLGDSPKEALRYVLYSTDYNINRIDRFIKRKNPFDIPDWKFNKEV